MSFYFMLYILWFCYGAVCGSFVKLCADRIPKGLTVVKGRSICDGCGRQLGAADLIPIFSWLITRGKCRSCGDKISVSHPVTEAACGLLFCAALYSGGLRPYTIALSLFFAGLLAAALIDAAIKKVPDKLNICLALFGALAAVCEFVERMGLNVWDNLYITVLPRAAGALAVPGLMLLLAVITKGFGGGDIKMLAAAGLFLGLKLSVICAALSFVMGGAYAAYLLIFKKAGRKTRIAFAPFISMAAVITAIVFGGRF